MKNSKEKCIKCIVEDFEKLCPILKAVILESPEIEEKFIRDNLDKLEGGGFFDSISSLVSKGFRTVANAPRNIGRTVADVFAPRLDRYSRKTKFMIKKFGNYPIVKLSIYRTPISGMLNTIINAVSLGKWEQLKAKYGFDKLYHLALVAQVNVNGVMKNLVTEKEEEVKLKDNYPTTSRTEVYELGNAPMGWTFNKLFDQTRQRVGDKTFFDYDAFKNNCQYFIKYLLETMGLYTPQAQAFLFQDLSKVAKEMPQYTKAIMKGTTRLGNIFAKLTGQGKPSQKYRAKYNIDSETEKKLEAKEDKIHELIAGIHKLSEMEDLREMIKNEVSDILAEDEGYKFADVVLDDVEGHIMEALKKRYDETDKYKNDSDSESDEEIDVVENAKNIIMEAKERIKNGNNNLDDLDEKIVYIMENCKNKRDLRKIKKLISNI